MKYLILWDIHWQYDRLLENLNQYFDKADKVILLWDYIDKNKDSLKVLEYLLDLKEQYPDKLELIWWNHDIFLINSILFYDRRLFYTWFYLSSAYKTTLFSYVPWNDRVLFYDGYDEFIGEYHDKISKDPYILSLAQRLLDNGKLYFRDEKIFCIHGGVPINIIRKNEFQFIDFYDWCSQIQWLSNLESDYKNKKESAIIFFWETKEHDPTWFYWATYYESMSLEGFKKLLDNLEVNYLFLGHRDWIKTPKYPKWDIFHCLNMGSKDIGYFYEDL